MPKGLTDSLEKFDLNNFNLSGFFTEVAIYLDNLDGEGDEQLDETCYNKISKAAEILRDKSREFRINEKNEEDISFFWKFYGQNKNEKDKEYVKNLYANRLLILSDEIAIAKDLSREKVGKLIKICVKLSEEARKYWNEQNHDGFKQYEHH